MTERRPLVIVGDSVEELPAGDTLPASGGGQAATPTTLPTGQTFTVDANTQVLFAEPIDLASGAELDLSGDLIEVN